MKKTITLLTFMLAVILSFGQTKSSSLNSLLNSKNSHAKSFQLKGLNPNSFSLKSTQGYSQKLDSMLYSSEYDDASLDNDDLINNTYVFTYNDNGYTSEVLAYQINSPEDFRSKEEYSYDDDNNLTEYIEYSYDWGDFDWYYSYKMEYTYDDETGYLLYQIEFDNYDESAQTWDTVAKSTYSYNDNGYLNEVLYYDYTEDEGFEEEKYEYSWDDNNQLTSMKYYTEEDGELETSFVITSDVTGGIIYDNNGNLTQAILGLYDNYNNWENNMKYVWEYDDNYNMTIETYYEYDNGWDDGKILNSNTYSSSYTVSETYSVPEDYYGVASADIIQISNNILTEQISYDEDENDNAYTITKTYYYSDVTTTDTDDDGSDTDNTSAVAGTQKANITLYPNPVSDYLQIEGVEGSVNVKIYSLQGQLIQSTVIAAGGTADMSELPVGTYVAKLQTQDGVTTKAIIKE